MDTFQQVLLDLDGASLRCSMLRPVHPASRCNDVSHRSTEGDARLDGYSAADGNAALLPEFIRTRTLRVNRIVMLFSEAHLGRTRTLRVSRIVMLCSVAHLGWG